MTSTARPICGGCTHYWGPDEASEEVPTPERCDAYPARIPEAILDNDADHRDPQPGDHGITYEPLTEAEADYAATVMAPRDE